MYILVKYGIQCPFTSNSSCEAMDGTAHKKSFQRRTGLSKVLILYFNIYFIVFYQFKLFVFSAKIRIFRTDLRQGYKGYRYFPSLGLTNILTEMFSSIRETWKLV